MLEGPTRLSCNGHIVCKVRPIIPQIRVDHALRRFRRRHSSGSESTDRSPISDVFEISKQPETSKEHGEKYSVRRTVAASCRSTGEEARVVLPRCRAASPTGIEKLLRQRGSKEGIHGKTCNLQRPWNQDFDERAKTSEAGK
jgi:hypothetical protein